MPTPQGGSIWNAAKAYQNVILPPLRRDALAGETADGKTDLARDALLTFNPGKQQDPDDLAVGELLRLGPALG